MELIQILELAGLLMLLAFSAFFSSAETAFFSLDSIQIEKIKRRHTRSGSLVEDMLEVPTRLLSTILIGNTIVNVAAAGLGFVIAESFLESHVELISIASMTFLLLVFGEVAPKRVAVKYPEKIAVLYSGTLAALIKLFKPLRLLLNAFLPHDHPSEPKGLSEDEFLSVVEAGEEEGVLDEEEREMVSGIIGLEETLASEVMTPRVDLIGLDLKDGPDQHRKTARRVSFRYLPVFEDSLDQPVGFLDVLKYVLSGADDIRHYMNEPFFIPETMPLDKLLSVMQHEKKRVAFVADEYGGTAGLVTRGDILEEITEDVDNEYGHQKEEIQQIDEGRWLIDGTVSLDDINEELDLDLDAEGADRIAGWVAATAEKMPAIGDVVKHQGVCVRVQRVRKRRILLVELSRLKEEEAEL